MAIDPRVRDAAGQFSNRSTVTAPALRKAWRLGGMRRPMKVGPTNTLSRPAAVFKDSRTLVQFDAIPSTFTADRIDEVNAIIRGVSVITNGLIARGHDLTVDDTTLTQMQACAEAKGQVPVKVDHKSGAAAVCGFLTNFRQQEGKLKADWYLLTSHPQKDQILEVARRMPRGVGLSAAFLQPEKPELTPDGKKAARCAELISVDYVTLPAANPDGMFSAKVDSNSTTMNPEILAAIEAAIAKAVAPLQEQIAKQQTLIDSLQAQPDPEGEQELTIEDLAQMSPEELAKLDLTPQDVAEAMAQIQAQGQDEGQGEGTEANDEAGETEAAAAPAGAGAAAGAGVGLSAHVSRQLVQLSAQLKQLRDDRESDKAEVLFASIEGKIATLVQENEHLRQALRDGSAPVKPGVDRNGIRFFSRGKEQGKFENLVQFHIEEKKLTKNQAFAAAMREDPAAYDDYLTRTGVRQVNA